MWSKEERLSECSFPGSKEWYCSHTDEVAPIIGNFVELEINLKAKYESQTLRMSHNYLLSKEIWTSDHMKGNCTCQVLFSFLFSSIFLSVSPFPPSMIGSNGVDGSLQSEDP